MSANRSEVARPEAATSATAHPVRRWDPEPVVAAVSRSGAPANLSGAHYAIGFGGALVCMTLFLAAHAALDAREPSTASATSLYLATAVVAAATLVGTAWVATRANPWVMAGLLAAVPLSFMFQAFGSQVGGVGCSDGIHWVWFGTWTESQCNPNAVIGWTVTTLVVAALGVAGIVAAVLASNRNASAGHSVALGTGFALAAAFGIASILLLPGMAGRADAARLANQPVVHSVPGLGSLAALAAVALAIVWARRRTV